MKDAKTPDLKPLKSPDGLGEIIATFGDINSYIARSKDNHLRLDPAFEREYIVSADLPYPLLAAWDHKKRISTIRCHALLAERFGAIFDEIFRLNLSDRARYFGGCYNFRNKRNGSGISTHSWGIAIDINPLTNRTGKAGDMDAEIVKIFARFGFIWGGTWRGKGRDPMHFQYCRGY
jgi:hypothetical protein